MKPSNLVRNLSVLVSHLENVCGHSETNHKFCIQASKAISRKLDKILNEPMMPASSPAPPNSFNVAQGLNTPLQALATPGMLSHIPLGGEELDLLDMKDLRL